MKRKVLIGFLPFLLACLSIWFLFSDKIHTMSQMSRNKKHFVVVIDAGHGGEDPGKVGINGALEKDINLRIAMYVADYLKQNDVQIVLTRNEDKGLCQPDSREKKMEDLKNRLALMESSGASLAVSIHQNSFTTEVVHGAQVFYYEGSQPGQKAAKIIQDRLKQKVDFDNKRVEKSNKSYFLLKRSTVPTIIVECGFLSNAKEADLLLDEAYQKKLAWNISLGILQYLNGTK